MEACLPQSVKLDDVEALRRLELGEEPDSGEDYLFRVRLEASKLPEVLEAPRRTDNGASSTDFNTRKLSAKPYLPHIEVMKRCPEGLQPRYVILMVKAHGCLTDAWLEVHLIPQQAFNPVNEIVLLL